MRLLVLQGKLHSQVISSNFQPPHVEIEPACLASPPLLLLVSRWLLLYILSYKSSIQLIFRWFSRAVVLQSMCNFNVIRDEVNTAFTYSNILTKIGWSWIVFNVHCSYNFLWLLWTFIYNLFMDFPFHLSSLNP